MRTRANHRPSVIILALSVSAMSCHGSASCQEPGLIGEPLRKPPDARFDLPNGNPTEADSDLTKGLLDFMVPLDAEPSSATKTSMDDSPANRMDHPLTRVQQLMNQSHAALRSAGAIQDAFQFQSQAIALLDRLIEQLEAQGGDQNRGDQNHGKSGRQSSGEGVQPPRADSDQGVGEKRGSAPSTSNSGDGAGEQDQAQSESNSSDSEKLGQLSHNSSGDPNNTGRATPGEVRMLDPDRLYESIWGHLPERVRSQIQANMIEEFLPSHRRQLEAYYRALLENR